MTLRNSATINQGISKIIKADIKETKGTKEMVEVMAGDIDNNDITVVVADIEDHQ
jgi:hypothetical protein